MNHLKKHFDKVLLAGFLILFCVILFIQLVAVSASTKPVGEQEVAELESMIPDYKKMPDSLILLREQMINEIAWRPVERIDTSILWASDLFELPTSNKEDKAQILNCRHCKKLVPYSDFANNKCSECGKEIQIIKPVVLIDSSGDGLPDEVKIKIGLDPMRNDLDEDKDGDGWSNYEEYVIALATTQDDFSAIHDAKKHPSLSDYLSFSKLSRKALPISLVSISPRDPQDPKSWDIIIKIGKNNRNSYKIDEKFSLGNEVWTIKEARLRENLTKKQRKDRIKIENEKKQTIIITADQKSAVYHPTVNYVIKDARTESESTLPMDGKITLGDENIGVEIFNLKKVNVKDKQAMLVNANDSRMIIQISEKAKRTGIVKAQLKEPKEETSTPEAKNAPTETSLDDLLK